MDTGQRGSDVSAGPLTRLRIGGLDTDVCEHCGGVWLDTDELAAIRR